MEMDHIFIFSNNQGREADALVNAGFTEGSSRRHIGQGTQNRKFYFKNFFHEVLWVVDYEEIKSPTVKPSQLWERSQFETLRYSRLGLCLVNSESTDSFFNESISYQPDYFPEGMSIDINTNDDYPLLPWTFRLPYRNIKKQTTEPISHPNQTSELTNATFSIADLPDSSPYLNYFDGLRSILFSHSMKNSLTLEFDNKRQGKEVTLYDLDLTITY